MHDSAAIQHHPCIWLYPDKGYTNIWLKELFTCNTITLYVNQAAQTRLCSLR